MKKIGDLTAQQSNVTSLKEEPWADEIGMTKKLREEVFIKHIKGPLFFGSTSDFQMMSKQIPETTTVVIMKMGDVTYMDQSGFFAMEDVLIDLFTKRKKVLLVNLLEQPEYMMEKLGIIPDLISKDHIFETKKDCLTWIKNNINNTIK